MPTRSPFEETGLDVPLRIALVAPGAAGDHSVPGIQVGDKIKSVWAMTLADGTVADLTDEFSVTADDTINNAGGTTLVGKVGFVYWFQDPTT